MIRLHRNAFPNRNHNIVERMDVPGAVDFWNQNFVRYFFETNRSAGRVNPLPLPKRVVFRAAAVAAAAAAAVEPLPTPPPLQC